MTEEQKKLMAERMKMKQKSLWDVLPHAPINTQPRFKPKPWVPTDVVKDHLIDDDLDDAWGYEPSAPTDDPQPEAVDAAPSTGAMALLARLSSRARLMSRNHEINMLRPSSAPPTSTTPNTAPSRCRPQSAMSEPANTSHNGPGSRITPFERAKRQETYSL